MTSFHLYVKTIFRHRILSIILLAGIIIPAALILFSISHLFPEFRDPIQIQLIFFQTTRILVLSNILFAYEFAMQARSRRMLETIQSIDRGVEKHYRKIFYVFLSLASLQFLLFASAQLLAGWLKPLALSSVLHYFLRSNFIYYFLLPLFGFLFGLTLSFLKQRLMSYLVIFGFIGLTLDSTLSKIALMPIQQSLPFWIEDVVRLFPQQASRPYIYGVPAETAVLFRVLFWSVLLVTLIVFSIRKSLSSGQRGISLVLCAALAGSTGWMAFRPSSLVSYTTSTLRGMSHDQLYYGQHSVIDEPASFQITQYDMDLTIRHQLSAVTRVAYHSNDTSRFMSFTLYHAYQVEQILDEAGNPVPFRQEGDYIDITRELPADGSLSFRYSGYAERFYSNDQGVNLPGYLPFYPHAGKYPVYHMSSVMMIPQQTGKTQFNVRISGVPDLKTNLKKVSQDTYSGTAESVSLQSGMYETAQVGPVVLHRPRLEGYDYERTLAESLLNNPALVNGEPLKQVTILPIMNTVGIYELLHISSDHLLTTSMETYDRYKNALKYPPSKFPIYTLWEDFYASLPCFEIWSDLDVAYAREHPEVLEPLDLVPDDLVNVEQTTTFILGKALNHASVDELYAILGNYLENQNDHRTSSEVLEDIREKYND